MSDQREQARLSRAARVTDAGAEMRSSPAEAAEGERPRETGGPKGPEPTRYGDWERAGRCIDF